MSFSTAGGGSLKAEINITPMIDVLLVLIIIFMVVVTMSNQMGLEAHIPQAAPNDAKSEPVRTVVIQVAWTGEQQVPTLKIND